MEALFWFSVLLVAYVYAGYPLLLGLWQRAFPRPVRKRSSSSREEWPAVSIVLAAHDEAQQLHGRLVNLLEQIYPGRLEVIVVSDGSMDDTSAVLERFGTRIRAIELPRGGKPTALNAGVAAATGDIVVFADARQRFAPDAIRELVANFADSDVGGVSGELILDCEDDATLDSTIGSGVGLYWKYEKWLRRHESLVWSTLGATGAIYALRRSLWQPLPAATLLDDVLSPMRVVLGGKRIVFEDKARAFDRVAETGSAESRRKVRTLAGNYQIITLEPRLLVPILNPVWIQYVSHKLGRLLVPWALLLAFVASTALAVRSWLYAVALLVQLVFYGLAAFGGWVESKRCADSGRTDEMPPTRSSDGQVLPSTGMPAISRERRARAG